MKHNPLVNSAAAHPHPRVARFFWVLSVTLAACGGQKASPTLSPQGSGGNSSANPADAATDASVPLVVMPDVSGVPPCTSPYAPVLEAVPTGAVLPMFANSSDELEIATTLPNQQDAALAWSPGDSIALPLGSTDLGVLARLQSSSCSTAATFANTYSVRDRFAPVAGQTGSTAIAATDAQLIEWATRVLDYQRGANLDDEWATPERALGPAGDDTTAVVSLGEGGSITLGFDTTLRDDTGYDFAVFENGFSDDYLELGLVEVSSDGVHFARFDSATLVDAPVGTYATIDATLIQGLAGKYRVGWGTPFDLAWLRARPEVTAGLVDLSHITAVRIVDLVGDGRVRDSFGHVAYDPYPTTGSAGFDLDAIGLIHANPR